MTSQTNRGWFGLFVVATLAALPLQVRAEATAQDLERLGKDLTPLGAERGANPDGSIPAWTGGLTALQVGVDPKKGYANPYSADKPLYTITAANMAQYQHLLLPGQVELLKLYPDFKYIVYPTRRSAAMPDWVLQNTLRDAPKAKIAEGGFGAIGVPSSGTTPFPLPKSGEEIMANFFVRFTGVSQFGTIAIISAQANGAFVPIKWEYDVTFSAKMPDAEPNRVYYFKQTTL